MMIIMMIKIVMIMMIYYDTFHTEKPLNLFFRLETDDNAPARFLDSANLLGAFKAQGHPNSGARSPSAQFCEAQRPEPSAVGSCGIHPNHKPGRGMLRIHKKCCTWAAEIWPFLLGENHFY